MHNANLLACSVVVRTSALRDEPLDERVAAAVATSVEAQRADGSWAYSAGPVGDWVDNFHTGYVLESLGRCAALVEGLDPALERGFDYWERELFLPTGARGPPRGAAFRSMRTTTRRRSRRGSPRWDGVATRSERAGRTADLWWRACSTPSAGLHELPARPVRDEPRPVRPLDDRARLPCARGTRAGAEHAMRVWIDLANSPHVPLVRPRRARPRAEGRRGRADRPRPRSDRPACRRGVARGRRDRRREPRRAGAEGRLDPLPLGRPLALRKDQSSRRGALARLLRADRRRAARPRAGRDDDGLRAPAGESPELPARAASDRSGDLPRGEPTGFRGVSEEGGSLRGLQGGALPGGRRSRPVHP